MTGCGRPEVGLGDMVDVAWALGLNTDGLALAAELLGLRACAPIVRAPAARGSLPRAAPRHGGTAPGATAGRVAPLEELAPGASPPLPVVVTVKPPEKPAAPVTSRTLAELLPSDPAPVPAPLGLFPVRARRALLRGISAIRAPQGGLDIEAAVEALAANRTFTQVPLEWVETTSGELELLLDVGESIDPYRHDIERLPEELTRVVGPDSLSLRWFEDCPSGGAWGPEDEKPAPYRLPPPGTRLLAVTVFGTRGALPASDTVGDWRRFGDACRRGGVPLLVLTPFPPARRPAEIGRRIAIVTWDRGTGVRSVTRAVRAARPE